jgi:hypothetical protein
VRNLLRVEETMTMTMTMMVKKELRARVGSQVVKEGGYFRRVGDGRLPGANVCLSGISVQNPDRPGTVPGGNVVRDLLRRAAECVLNLSRFIFEFGREFLLMDVFLSAGPAPAAVAGQASARLGFFSGGGHTLGSDEVESEFIPDPDAPPRPQGMSHSVL